jgi:hypothetical protein
MAVQEIALGGGPLDGVLKIKKFVLFVSVLRLPIL